MASAATEWSPETWTAIEQQFPCPHNIWYGVWEEVGQMCGKTWDVWAAVYAALSARAQRNLHWYYVRASLFGMSYTLCVAPTGMGKEYAMDICEALLPAGYRVRDAIQSGQALIPAISLPAEKGSQIRQCLPTILIVNEWVKLAKLGGIQHSTLIDDLDAIYHRNRNWSVTRSDRGDAPGGGDRELSPPILSIFGATTPSALCRDISKDTIYRGFLNRYLILPGNTESWTFWPQGRMQTEPRRLLTALAERLSSLNAYTWGEGQWYQCAFSPAAAERLRDWGEDYFTPIMRQSSLLASMKKRLHMHTVHIALLATWAQQEPLVQLPAVEMAMTVVGTADKFIDVLYSEPGVPLTTGEQGDALVEDLILRKVDERPGWYTSIRLRQALRHKGISLAKISRVIKTLVQENILEYDPESLDRGLTRKKAERSRRPSPLLLSSSVPLESDTQLMYSNGHGSAHARHNGTPTPPDPDFSEGSGLRERDDPTP